MQPNNINHSIDEVGVRLREQEEGWINSLLECMDKLQLQDWPSKKQMIASGYKLVYTQICDGMGWKLFKDIYSGRN